MNVNHFHKTRVLFLKKHLDFIRISIRIRLKPKCHHDFKSERKGGKPKMRA